MALPPSFSRVLFPFGFLALVSSFSIRLYPMEKLSPRSCEQLLKAACKGLVTQAQAALDAGIPVDCTSVGYGNQTPLQLAVRLTESYETVALLLKHKADVKRSCSSGRTPLHNARTGAIAQLLLDYGADRAARDTQGNTPLHEAAYWGRLDVVQVLLEHGADVHAQACNNITPLDSILECLDRDQAISIVRLLIMHGAHVTEKHHKALSDDCLTPLELAVLFKTADEIERCAQEEPDAAYAAQAAALAAGQCNSGALITLARHETPLGPSVELISTLVQAPHIPEPTRERYQAIYRLLTGLLGKGIL
jgi:hypothetical protein